jgi:uncharacterized membrane-anchored protein
MTERKHPQSRFNQNASVLTSAAARLLRDMSRTRASAWAWLPVLCFSATLLLRADDPTPPPRPSSDMLAAVDSSLKWQTGKITIKDGLAQINLTPDFRFLDSADAQKVLHTLWGNPDDPNILGMIFPKDKDPLDRDAWAVTVRYDPGGYMKDDDAGKIDYNDMLKKIQQSLRDGNADREKEGYPSIDLIGWAAPPHYDQATHKLYWAKDVKFGNDKVDVLNYDIRILGRRGWLELDAIADMSDFPQINEKIPQVLSMVDFQAGNTYAEFDPKVDKVAEYGLATLVAGGVLAGAAKLGLFGAFFKYIVVAALALKKLLIVVVLGIVAGVKGLWSKMTGKASTPKHLLPPKDGPPPVP